jgi:hypothetical protein
MYYVVIDVSEEPTTSIFKVAAAGSSKMLVTTYDNIWRYNPDDHNVKNKTCNVHFPNAFFEGGQMSIHCKYKFIVVKLIT